MNRIGSAIGRRWQKISTDNQMILIAALAAFLSGLVFQTAGGSTFNGACWIAAYVVMLAMPVIFVIAVIWSVRRGKGATDSTVHLLIAEGFLLRLFYNVMLPFDFMQNDLEWFINEGEDMQFGHLGYIFYIFEHWRLPNVDPMLVEHYQYYHPPLHHFLSAVWMKMYALLGVDSEFWTEALQMLPLLYMTILLIYMNKLGKLFDCSALGRCVTVGLAAFFPYSVFMGGALNNDTLMILLGVMCLYYTVKWYRNPTMKGILLMAVCIGCSMMAKLSGVLIAPAMAIVMLWRLFQDRQEWKKYFRQFLCFGLVSFPLGLWYSVLRYVQYGMPLGYVMSPEESGTQYIGWYSKLERFKNFKYALSSLSLRWNWLEGDFNIPVSLVKYGVFNELDFYRTNDFTYVLGTVVFWATFALFGLFVIAFIAWLFMKEYKVMDKVLFGVAAVVILVSYVYFCWEYPYVCTMNIRYVMTVVYIGMLVIGLVVSGIQKRLGEKENKRVGRVFERSVGAGFGIYMLCCVLLMLTVVALYSPTIS